VTDLQIVWIRVEEICMSGFSGSFGVKLPVASGLFVLMLIVAVSLDAQAQSRPSILIAGVQPASNGTIANELYTAVVRQISRRINESGFEAVTSENEAAAIPDNNDVLLLQEAVNMAEKQIELVTVLQVLANTTIESDGTRIQIEIVGRIRDVGSGKLVENFSVKSPEDLIAPRDCNIRCVIRTLILNATVLADRVGDSVANRLIGN
jgi:hypothetical protein